MVVLEGRLNARSPGLLGAWQDEDFKLTSEALEVFSAEDPKQARQRILLNTLVGVGFASEKNECIVAVPEGNWRLQAASEAETRSWATQIQNQSGIIVQVDTLAALPKAPYPDAEYQVVAKIKGLITEQLTLAERGKAGAAAGTEECIIRQQLFVVAPKPRTAPLEVRVMRRSAGAEGDFDALGSFEIGPIDADGGKTVVCKLLNDGKEVGGVLRLKVKGWGEPAKKKNKLDLPEKAPEQSTDLRIIDKLMEVLDAKSLSIHGLLRNKRYNPKWQEGLRQELTAVELHEIFSKAEVNFSQEEVAHLVKVIDQSGNRKLDVNELERALRMRKQGTLTVEEQQRNPPLDYKRSHVRSSKNEGLPPNNARSVLDAISAFLDNNRLRMTDLFRHAKYNPSYFKTGDEELDAGELCQILSKAGLELDPKDAGPMMKALDKNGDGKLNIDELQSAIRHHRQGVDVTGPEYQKSVSKKKVKRDVNKERLTWMYEEHFRNQKKLEVKREINSNQELVDIEKGILAEKQKLAEEKKRANVKEYELKAESEPDEVGKHDHRGHKLYKDAQTKDMHLHQLCIAVEREEREKRLKVTFRPPSRTRRSQSAGGISAEKKVEARTKLLYERGAAQFSNRQRMKEASICSEICDLDVVGQRGLDRGPTNRHIVLHDMGMELKKKVKVAAEAKQKVEIEKINAVVEARRKKNGAVAPPDTQKVEEWHNSHLKKLELRKKSMNERICGEEAKRKKDYKDIRAKTAETYTQISSRWQDPKITPKNSHSANPNDASNTSVASTSQRSERGFGNSTARTLMGGRLEKVEHRLRVLEAHDHAIAFVNQAVASRCGCVPSDGPPAKMRLLTQPVREILERMRLAAEEVANSKNPGTEWLKTRNNQRLFSGGKLVEDPVAWHDCCEPDPIQQIEQDFDLLLENAQKAQAHLLGMVGPEDRSIAGNDQEFARRWPPGSTWQKPRVARMAQFAFNPGPKPREAAQAKAFVRYAPSNKEEQYRQVLDFARLSIVFANASLLRAGLESILDEFEVVAVLNYYNSSMAGIVTHKRIDVYVVVQDDELSFTPHICEIRLEELPFHLARKEIVSPLKKVGKIFCEMYENRKTISDTKAIRYLSAYSLFRTKERHQFTIFRRHLANVSGSAAVAWRREFGNAAWVNFHKFRDICSRLAYRNRCCEFWQELDCSMAGHISLFTLDPDAVVLLARFYARLMGLVRDDTEADVEVLFGKLTAKNVIKQVTPGKLELHEFRTVLQPLGFTKTEADLLFDYLDVKGGSNCVPPATINLHDIAWLKRLPELVDIDSVMLTPPEAATVVEHLRVVGQDRTSGRRARMPTMSLDENDPSSNMAKVRRSSAFLGVSFVAQKSFNADGTTQTLSEQLAAAWGGTLQQEASTPSSPRSPRGTVQAVGATRSSPRESSVAHLKKVATGVYEEGRDASESDSDAMSEAGREDHEDVGPEVSASESGDDFMRSLTRGLDTDDDDKDAELQSTEDEPTAATTEDELRRKLTQSLVLSDSEDEDFNFVNNKATMF